MLSHVLAMWLAVLGAAAGGGPPLGQLQAKLDAMLTPSGQLADADQAEALVKLASEAGEATAQMQDDATQRMAARVIQMRAYMALTLEAMAQKRAGMASLRLVQMRGAAEQLQKLQKKLNPSAPGPGDYGLLVADLIEANRNGRTLAARQIAAVAQLARFVSLYEADAGARHSPIVIEAELSLLKLYDQVGENEQAMALMRRLLAVIGMNDPRAADFAQIAASAKLVGQALDPSLRKGELDGKSWLLLLIDDAVHAPDATTWQQIKDRAGEQADPPVKLARRLVDEKENPAAALPQGLGDSLPRYLLVNPQGEIVAAGRTAAVLERMGELAR